MLLFLILFCSVNGSDEQPLDFGALFQNGRIIIAAAFHKQLQSIFAF